MYVWPSADEPKACPGQILLIVIPTVKLDVSAAAFRKTT